MKTLNSCIGILGAGIMGCCTALALSKRGFRVELFDMADQPMTAASLHNEGKLHLGYVYAKDPDDLTYRMMIRGSLSFGRLIGELTGANPSSLPVSTPFQYIVPHDSQIPMDAVAEHFDKVDSFISNCLAEQDDLYLGRDLTRARRNDPEFERGVFREDAIQGSFSTGEVSVSPYAIAGVLRAAISKDANIRFHGKQEIISVQRLSSGRSQVEILSEGLQDKRIFDCVVNCLWGDKIRIDRTADIIPNTPMLLRYKAAIRIQSTGTEYHGLPSVTAVLGPYGDLVNFGQGDFYLSWYPLCKLAELIDGDQQAIEKILQDRSGLGLSLLPPANDRSRNASAPEMWADFTHSCIHAMSGFIPALKGLASNHSSLTLGGGIILAAGSTDIDDPQSRLHQRYHTGPRAYGSYITVDTGKYCLAPMHAMDTADMVTAILE